jgi:broad specificity phosphatase PhoE
MPDLTTCTLYLIRHGATEHNLARPPRLQGRHTDAPLSAEGRRQAGATAALLARRPFTAIYSSPLRRARETASVVSRPHELPVSVIEPLIEVDVGEWEGQAWVEIALQDPERYQQFMTDPGNYGYPGGENMAQVVHRVARALEEIMCRHLGQEIVVVAHNVVNRCYLGHLLDMSQARARGIPQDNCGVNLIRYRDRAAHIVSINAVLHLEPGCDESSAA